MKVAATLTVDTAGLDRFKKSIQAQQSNGTSGFITKAYGKWAVRYRAFVQRRWNVFSRGGGDWPPLSPATIKKRRGPSKKNRNRTVSILRDTNILFSGMAPTLSPPAGSINNLIEGGIEVGFAGSARHGDDVVTIPELVFWHHTGAGNNPVRQIIVAPDAATVAGMGDDLDKAIAQEIKSSESL